MNFNIKGYKLNNAVEKLLDELDGVEEQLQTLNNTYDSLLFKESYDINSLLELGKLDLEYAKVINTFPWLSCLEVYPIKDVSHVTSTISNAGFVSNNPDVRINAPLEFVQELHNKPKSFFEKGIDHNKVIVKFEELLKIKKIMVVNERRRLILTTVKRNINAKEIYKLTLAECIYFKL